MLRFLLTTSRVQIVLGIGAVLLSFAVAYLSDKADYFSRSGSIMALLGGVLTFRRYLRGAENSFLRDTGLADQPSGARINPLQARMVARAADYNAMRYGIAFIIAGTLVWGYGDLLMIGLRLCSK